MDNKNSKAGNYHMSHRLNDLRQIVEKQVNEPTSKTDDYMRGMANGLKLAWTIMMEPYGTDPQYFEAQNSPNKT